MAIDLHEHRADSIREIARAHAARRSSTSCRRATPLDPAGSARSTACCSTRPAPTRACSRRARTSRWRSRRSRSRSSCGCSRRPAPGRREEAEARRRARLLDVLDPARGGRGADRRTARELEPDPLPTISARTARGGTSGVVRLPSIAPHRDGTDGFFIARLRALLTARPLAAAGTRRAAARSAPAAASGACGPTNLPGRYRCISCLRRYELRSDCPDCGAHATIARMPTPRTCTCRNCGGSMLVAI